MKQQSQKKNKKLIAGAIFGMAAGLAAASVPVIIPLMINGAVAKPSEGHVINLIDEKPTIIDENTELILSKEQPVVQGEEYEIVVDTTVFQDFTQRNWGIAVGEINTEQQIDESIIDTVDITLDDKTLYENVDYTIEEDEKGGKIVVGNQQKKQGLLRVKLKVNKSKDKAHFAFSSYYVEPDPEQDWEWNGYQAELKDLTLASDTEYTFVLKNFSGMDMYKATKLEFFIADNDGGYVAPLQGTEKVYYNKKQISKTEPDVEGGYWFNESGNIINFKQTIDRSDSFKISLKFNIPEGREWSGLYAIIRLTGDISEPIELNEFDEKSQQLIKTQSVSANQMYDIKCNLSLFPSLGTTRLSTISIVHGGIKDKVIFDLTEAYVNQTKVEFSVSSVSDSSYEILLNFDRDYLSTDVIYLRNIQFTQILRSVNFKLILI